MDVNLIKEVLAKNSPAILTGLGIAGFIATTVLACKATPSAVVIHERHEDIRFDLMADKGSVSKAEHRQDVLTEAKELAVVYAPSVISGGLSIACILGAHKIQANRTAAIATAYSLAERTLSTYQDKVLEKLGEDGGRELMQAVSDKLAEDDAPFDGGYSYHPEEDGKTLCYDRVTGRYFRSTVDDIRSAESEVNKRLIDEVVVPLSEFYFYLGLDDKSFICDGLGWDLGKNKLDVYFTSMLDKDENPCLVVNYNVGVVDRRIFESRR